MSVICVVFVARMCVCVCVCGVVFRVCASCVVVLMFVQKQDVFFFFFFGMDSLWCHGYLLLYAEKHHTGVHHSLLGYLTI
jgi:hypothetical protein